MGSRSDDPSYRSILVNKLLTDFIYDSALYDAITGDIEEDMNSQFARTERIIKTLGRPHPQRVSIDNIIDCT